MKKKLLLFFIIYILLCTCTAYASPIYSKEEVIPITDGVALTKVESFYSDYNLSYSYITADLSQEHLDLKLLTSQNGIDTLDTVSRLAATEANTVAALNADFFSVYAGHTGFSLGVEIKDGALLQSPINPSTMATVYKENDQVHMSYLDFHIMVVAPDWEYREIRHLNKHTSYFGDILMYTHEFNGGYSPAPGGEVLEVVVEDGKILEFRRNMPPCKIPKNGCVLVISEGADMFFANHFKEGDPVKFDYYITPDLKEAQEAFGGGAMLVSEGEALSTFSHVVSGYNPRSAIGVDKTGTRITLLAVNGRQANSRGVTMTELARMMQELGCYYAVNLDGGGSTNMVASTVWAPQLHTVNSPTENRRVINAVGITGSLVPDGEPDGIILETDDPAVFIGQSTKVSYAVYDKTKHAVDKEAKLFSNKGKIEDNIFTATRGGDAVIYAECGDAEGEISVYVVDEISGIVMDDSFMMEAGDSRNLSFDVFDADGHYVHVTNTEPFSFRSSDTSVVFFKDNKLTAKKDGVAIISVEKDGVVHYATVYVGANTADYTDDFEVQSGSFAAYPESVKGDFQLSDYFAVSGAFAGKLSYDFKDNTDETRGAYFVPNQPIPVAASCKEITVFCASDKEFSHTVKAQITDGDGTVHRISFEGEIAPLTMQKITAKIPNDMKAPLTLTRIYVVALPGENADAGHLFFDDLSLQISVPLEKVAVPAAVYDDPMEARASGKAVFSVGAVAQQENTLLDRLTYLAAEKEMRKKGVVALVGGMRTANKQLSTEGFGVKEEGDTLYITVDTQKGGIRATDATQWDRMYDAVSHTDAKYIFILSDTDVFGANAFENEAMVAFLGNLPQKVFVISRGEANGLIIKNNVRYFTLCDAACGIHLSDYTYLQFTFGEEVSYAWKQIW